MTSRSTGRRGLPTPLVLGRRPARGSMIAQKAARTSDALRISVATKCDRQLAYTIT